ncbi:MAG TPA: amidase family protein [Solirubrobacteraceae bacterium]|nr:amidase family protein [Solirubrobacteraceae bacterium]
MFPTRATGRVRGPSAEQVKAYAERHHLRLDDAGAERMAQAIAGGLAGFDRIDELEPPTLPVRHTDRDPGRPPAPGEDPFNAVVRFCEVGGAEDGPLAGRTVGVKDCISVAGVPTTNGGRRLPHAVPTEDAVVVERLLDAGARITMKTNMEDLALGLGEGSFFGAARNPVDPRFSTGGSSSGSAAAVAAGMVDLALGADEAGSVRIPAAWCGLVGMKATHGLVPSYGMSYMDHTLDHIGPMTRTVADNAGMLEVMAGADWRDPQWVRADPVPGAYAATETLGIEGLRIAVVEEALEANGCTRDVLAAFFDAERRLTELGAKIDRVSVPLWGDAWAIEATAIPFGLHAMVGSGGQGVGHLGRIDVGAMAATGAQTRLGAADLPPFLHVMLLTVEHMRDAYLGVHFGRAQNLRLELRRQVAAAFAGADLLITPTTPATAFALADGPLDDAAMAARMNIEAVFNTCPLDLTGHPALTVPAGTGAHGLPVGLQLIGRHFDEERIYQAAFAFERGAVAEPAVAKPAGAKPAVAEPAVAAEPEPLAAP